MIQILFVTVISIDKSEEPWILEGEILLEGDLSAAFSVSYLPNEDELEDLRLDIDLEDVFDYESLKNQIREAALAYEE